jgi:hypothetical protein
MSEAIDTLRTAWGFEAENRAGAAPGVAPAHRIGIWVGGAGPRMLGLIGRKADGWIAPMATGYETKPAAQDRLDAAATPHSAQVQSLTGWTTTRSGGAACRLTICSRRSAGTSAEIHCDRQAASCSRTSANPAEEVEVAVADRLPQGRHDGVHIVVRSLDVHRHPVAPEGDVA